MKLLLFISLLFIGCSKENYPDIIILKQCEGNKIIRVELNDNKVHLPGRKFERPVSVIVNDTVYNGICEYILITQ